MDPATAILVSGAITAGSQLLGGLFGQHAARKAEDEARELSAAQTGLSMTQNRLGQEQQAQQSALGNLMAAYRSGLGG